MTEVILSAGIAIAAFAILLPLIVFVHEYGHFKVARLCGIRVDTFSIGFGPALFGWTDRQGTRWKIAAIPLGGFVKFFGDANAASAGVDAEAAAGPATTQFSSERARLEALLTPDEKRVCFHFKPVWQRALVVLAGPVANFIMAIVIFAGLLMIIGERAVQPVVGEVTPASAAAEAGFLPGDRIVRAGGRRTDTFDDVAIWVRLSSNTPIVFEVDRDGTRIELTATPRRVTQQDAFGNEIEAGQLGITSAAEAIAWRRYGPVEAVGAGTARVGTVVDASLRYLGRLVSFREDPRQMGGPVKIAQFAGQAVRSGFDPAFEISLLDRIFISLAQFLELAALLSVSIGFLNLLPVPVLDGGHLLYYGYEAVAGRPLSERVQAVGFRIGLALVGSLMVFVLLNDVVSLF